MGKVWGLGSLGLGRLDPAFFSCSSQGLGWSGGDLATLVQQHRRQAMSLDAVLGNTRQEPLPSEPLRDAYFSHSCSWPRLLMRPPLHASMGSKLQLSRCGPSGGANQHEAHGHKAPSLLLLLLVISRLAAAGRKRMEFFFRFRARSQALSEAELKTASAVPLYGPETSTPAAAPVDSGLQFWVWGVRV